MQSDADKRYRAAVAGTVAIALTAVLVVTFRFDPVLLSQRGNDENPIVAPQLPSQPANRNDVSEPETADRSAQTSPDTSSARENDSVIRGIDPADLTATADAWSAGHERINSLVKDRTLRWRPVLLPKDLVLGTVEGEVFTPAETLRFEFFEGEHLEFAVKNFDHSAIDSTFSWAGESTDGARARLSVYAHLTPDGRTFEYLIQYNGRSRDMSVFPTLDPAYYVAWESDGTVLEID
ncbi:MAG: hypothetical protein AAFX44_05175 [Pseudomonadota bacterium]